MGTYHKLFVYTNLLILFFTQCQGQSIVETNKKVYSTILDQEVEYSVILPPNYKESANSSYPVIYLLHGINGDQNSWLQRSRINILIDSLTEIGELGDFIYVMPAAYNSYYINNYNGAFRYMDFFIEDLLPAIDSIYRTTPGKTNRALLGISMGGFGSVILGLKHPGKFGSIVCLSGALRTEAEFMKLTTTKYTNFFGEVFGPGLEAEARITDHWKMNSPYYITDSTVILSAQNLNWSVDCGFDDFLFSSNESFHQWLIKNKIAHDYHIRPGQHNWSYWYQSTINGLKYLDSKMYR
jgi:enterochelin esterase-like enzyme